MHALIAVAMLLSDFSDSDSELPPSPPMWSATDGSSSGRDPGMFDGMPLSDSMSDGEPERSRTSRPPAAELNVTRRGKHSRDTARKKLSHADQAHESLEAVRATALTGCCSSG